MSDDLLLCKNLNYINTLKTIEQNFPQKNKEVLKHIYFFKTFQQLARKNVVCSILSSFKYLED